MLPRVTGAEPKYTSINAFKNIMAAEDEQFTHILGDYLVKVSAFTIVIDSSYLLWTSTRSIWLLIYIFLSINPTCKRKSTCDALSVHSNFSTTSIMWKGTSRRSLRTPQHEMIMKHVIA